MLQNELQKIKLTVLILSTLLLFNSCSNILGFGRGDKISVDIYNSTSEKIAIKRKITSLHYCNIEPHTHTMGLQVREGDWFYAGGVVSKTYYGEKQFQFDTDIWTIEPKD